MNWKIDYLSSNTIKRINICSSHRRITDEEEEERKKTKRKHRDERGKTGQEFQTNISVAYHVEKYEMIINHG